MTAIPQDPGIQPQKKSSGCLKYAVIGCSVALVGLAIIAAVVAAVALSAVKSTDAYKEARRRATTDPRVISALGAPVTAGFIATGSVKIDNREGTAVINFPLSGTRQRANVHVEATRDGEGWHHSIMRVEPKSGPPIDLLTP